MMSATSGDCISLSREDKVLNRTICRVYDSEKDFGFSAREALNGQNDIVDGGKYHLDIVGSKQHNGLINQESTVDYIDFSVPKEQQVQIMVDKSEFPSVIHLFRKTENGLSYISYDDSANSPDNKSVISANLISGDYVVAVSDFGGCRDCLYDVSDFIVNEYSGDVNAESWQKAYNEYDKDRRICEDTNRETDMALNPKTGLPYHSYDFGLSTREAVEGRNNIENGGNYKLEVSAQQKLEYLGYINTDNTVDYYHFSLSEDTDVSIKISESDFSSISYLFRDDKSLDQEDYISYDDDTDGSSVIQAFLPAGDYIVATSDFGICGCKSGEEQSLAYIDWLSGTMGDPTDEDAQAYAPSDTESWLGDLFSGGGPSFDRIASFGGGGPSTGGGSYSYPVYVNNDGNNNPPDWTPPNWTPPDWTPPEWVPPECTVCDNCPTCCDDPGYNPDPPDSPDPPDPDPNPNPPAPVPEPATMLLFGTGLSGLIAYGRKKRKIKK